jgi:hypothetical protein
MSETSGKPGRPAALDQALMDEICAHIAEGRTIRQIAQLDHMPVASTIYLTLARNEKFSDQYAKARQAQLTRWEDEIIEIADNGSNDWMRREGKDGETSWAVNGEAIGRSRLRVDSRKWIMSKRLPKVYGERITQENTGPNGGPQEHVHTHKRYDDMSLEELQAEINARSASS